MPVHLSLDSDIHLEYRDMTYTHSCPDNTGGAERYYEPYKEAKEAGGHFVLCLKEEF